MDQTQDFLAWNRRFWLDRPGDSLAAIVEEERYLEARLPPLLRAAYAATPLRLASQLHLRDLEALEIDDDEVLVFAFEQQNSWQWGIRTEHLKLPNPPLVSNQSGQWVDDRSDLLGFLRFFVVLNRVFEPPLLGLQGAVRLDDPTRLQSEWIAASWSSASFSYRVFVRGGAAADVWDGPSVRVGARDSRELKDAIASLDIRVSDDDLALELNPEQT